MKKKIILSVYLFVAMATVFTSCKKEVVTDNPVASVYYMRFKANGVQKEYKIPGTNATTGNNPGISHDSTIIGGNKLHSYTFAAFNEQIHYLQIGVFSDVAAVTGYDYKEADYLFWLHSRAVFLYNEEPQNFPFLSIGVYAPDPYTYPTTLRACKLNISQITTSFMKGTFLGTVYKEDSNGDPILSNKINITDGEFYLPVQK